MGRRRGFTLLELLVVVGVIVLLVAILLPTISTAREQARMVKCQNNLRQLWQGCVSFAADHDHHMPGGYFDWNRTDPDQRDWLMGATVTNRMTAPQAGTLFKYVGRNYEVYRCPSLDLAETPSGGPGGGSNGRFDYSIFLYASGCKLDRLPQTAAVINTISGPVTTATFPAPVIVEEEQLHMNSSHGTEGGHSNTDAISNHHRGGTIQLPNTHVGGGSFFAATDGSVQWIEPPYTNCDARAWSTTSMRGNKVDLGSVVSWGWYQKQ